MATQLSRRCVDCKCETGHTEVSRPWLGRKHRWCNRCNRMTEFNWVHLAHADASFCQSPGPTTDALESVSCTDCLKKLLFERAVAPIPDWRHAEAIPEDHYAA